jgi:hypothetical protein
VFLSRDPGVFFVLLYFCTFVLLYSWPTATDVMALRPHQTKRKQTAVSSLLFIKELAQPPRNIFALYKTTAAKSRHGVRFNFDLHLQTSSALFENAIASDGTSDVNGFTNVVMAGCQGTTCTAKASEPSMASSRILL